MGFQSLLICRPETRSGSRWTDFQPTDTFSRQVPGATSSQDPGTEGGNLWSLTGLSTHWRQPHLHLSSDRGQHLLQLKCRWNWNHHLCCHRFHTLLYPTFKPCPFLHRYGSFLMQHLQFFLSFRHPPPCWPGSPARCKEENVLHNASDRRSSPTLTDPRNPSWFA